MYQSRILKNGAESKCMFFANNKETIDHFTSRCSTRVNTEYLQKLDRVAKYIAWSLGKHQQKPKSEKCFKHISESVVEEKNVMVLLNFAVSTDTKIDANPPIIIIKYFKEQICIMLDVTIPAYKNVSVK